jgi:hypothetical protein
VDLYNQYKEKGFEIVSINVADSAEDVAQFFRKFNARHIGALNKTDTDVMGLYGVEGTPANFVIDREGRLVGGKISGYGKGDTRIDRALKKAGLGAE